MKVKYKEKIGVDTVIKFITDAVPDSEETKKRIASLITPEMTEDEIERLYMENLVYAKVGAEADLIDDELGDRLQSKLDAKEEHRLLSDNGEYIADYRGVEYWIKKSDRWKKEKIEEIGVELPEDAFLQEDVTPEQQREISDQQEADRINAMSDEEKENAKQAALNSLADEADRLDRRAKIQQQPFDPVVWYGEHARDVELKYA